jgi:hypothetical protein
LASHTNRLSRRNKDPDIGRSIDRLRLICSRSQLGGEDSISAGVRSDDAIRAREHHKLGTRLDLGGESIVYFDGDAVMPAALLIPALVAVLLARESALALRRLRARQGAHDRLEPSAGHPDRHLGLRRLVLDGYPRPSAPRGDASAGFVVLRGFGRQARGLCTRSRTRHDCPGSALESTRLTFGLELDAELERTRDTRRPRGTRPRA